jgi:hypothetical protein
VTSRMREIRMSGSVGSPEGAILRDQPAPDEALAALGTSRENASRWADEQTEQALRAIM